MTSGRIGRGLVAGLAVTLASALLAIPAAAWTGAPGTVDEDGEEIREIVFPVSGDVHFTDTWLYPRSNGRRHIGVDLMGDKHLPVLAAADGCITRLRTDGNNQIVLTDADGWRYHYIHLNNDTPGTDDGAAAREFIVAGDLQLGDCVEAGDHVSYLGDSGNAEETLPHLHFEIQRPDDLWINPFLSVEAADQTELRDPDGDPNPDTDSDPNTCGTPTNPAAEPSELSGRGAWVLAADGSVVATGAAESLGDLTTVEDAADPVAIRSTPTGEGYWIVDADGVVHPFGDAEEHGDMSGVELNGPVLGLEAHPNAGGYWLVADDGGVFSFGDSTFHGSMGATTLNAPVISMGSTATGDGYFLVAADGGVFTFGDAEFQGSTGSLDLAAPIISMGVHPEGTGYWLYAADGGVFSYGVPFHGSIPGLALCDEPTAVSLRVSDTGDGYWVLAADGQLFSFGDALGLDAVELGDGVGAVDLAIRHVGEPSSEGDPGDPMPDGDTEDPAPGNPSGEAGGGSG